MLRMMHLLSTRMLKAWILSHLSLSLVREAWHWWSWLGWQWRLEGHILAASIWQRLLSGQWRHRVLVKGGWLGSCMRRQLRQTRNLRVLWYRHWRWLGTNMYLRLLWLLQRMWGHGLGLGVLRSKRLWGRARWHRLVKLLFSYLVLTNRTRNWCWRLDSRLLIWDSWWLWILRHRRWNSWWLNKAKVVRQFSGIK